MITITKKEQLIELFQDAIELKSHYIAVEVETRGSDKNEIIINPYENFEKKLEYYVKAYNDDLVLNTYDGIRIISAISLDDNSEMYDVEVALKTLRFE